MRALYTFSIRMYSLAIRLAAPFYGKAKDWVKGRKNWKTGLRAAINAQSASKDAPKTEWIWFHCASLGEFEQGRNLIEWFKAEYPAKKILLTFYSPSGYNVRKSYAHADYVCYMPLDTPAQAKAFLDIVQPSMVFFIKYEIWVNFLLEMKARKLPVFLVSAYVKKNSKFFGSGLKSLYKQAFQAFSWIFTQDQDSLGIIRKNTQLTQLSVSGDTRFDRVVNLPDQFEEVKGIQEFVGETFCIVVGSSWEPDKELLFRSMNELKGIPIKWIIAPHEIHPKDIDEMIRQYPERMVKYSNIDYLEPEHDILWIDNVGMLNRLYHYADLAYIGGGFGSGIHNTQEPAAYGVPIAFGPKYHKFKEAVDLVALGCAYSVDSHPGFVRFFKRFHDDPEELAQTRKRIIAYIQEQSGATATITTHLKEKGFLPEQA